MDTEKINEAEAKYQELNEKLRKGEISSEEMKQELKKLMIRDEDGSYWMIGGKTGKWYKYDGAEWKEAIPYKESQAEDIFREDISPLEVEVKVEQEESSETQLFPQKQDETVKLESPLDTIIYDSRSEETKIEVDQVETEGAVEPTIVEKAAVPTREEFEKAQTVEEVMEEERFGKLEIPKKAARPAKEKPRGDELVITAIDMVSLMFFLGGIGLIVGVLFGATFGIFTQAFGNLINHFPEILQGTQGGLAGGLIFAAIGGIGGFILFAVMGAFISSIYNLIAYIFGGIRFKIK